MSEHAPCEHTWPPAHCVPQPPQFRGSEVALTQVSPHAWRPEVHRHVPPTQLWLLPHVTPHMPQFLKSVDVSTHVP
jgi:hypothetical protein